MNNFRLCAFADEASASLKGQIDALTENNIDQLEIRGVDGKNISEILPGEAKSIRERLDASGISVWSIGSPSGKIKITEDFTPHLSAFSRMLETADILGASRIRLFSFYGFDGSPAARDEIMERLLKFTEAAKGSGVLLCHENEKDIFGESPENCLYIHRNIPEIKAVFDPANFIQSGVETLRAWELLEPFVNYLHIKDAKAGGAVVPAGRGDGRLPEIISRFGALGGGTLSLEPHLAVFDGLAALEQDQKSTVGEYTYKNNREAFGAAASALRELLSKGRSKFE